MTTTPPFAELAGTGDGRDITRPWIAELEQPRDPRLVHSSDWGAYDQVRKDDRVKAVMEQRVRAVVSQEWDVLPGDEIDPRSRAAAKAMKGQLSHIGLDRVTEKLLWARLYGIQIAELIWGPQENGLIGWDRVRVRHARRFRFDRNGSLRLLTRAAPRGVPMPDRHFWVVRSGATHDDEPYGEGLAAWLYWPCFFKRNGIRFWNIFLDKFGAPPARLTYSKGITKAQVNDAMALLRSLNTDSGIAIPEGIAVDLLEAARSGTGDYRELIAVMNAAITTIILSQTMTTEDGSSMSQAKVHAGVKSEIVKADADLLSESFNDGPARWWTDLNFGTDVAAPRLVRLLEEPLDLKALAETDEILARTGWVRTAESFRDLYGDGYTRVGAQ
jgi:phage gp29-like protein